MSWDIPVGTEFAGYRITGVLGRGGMSVVYSAEHLSLGRMVALKVLSPMLSEDVLFRERFIRESKLAAALEHPNIIPIYDAGEVNGVLYIAMRHVSGGDLGSRIKREGPLGLGQTIFFFEQVSGALDEAHSQGLVHRDVKPANILIDSNSDRVYLADFGVVKQTAVPGLTRTGNFLGTFAYAAPEQIDGKPIDGRTDLYALGCVLHECLAGAPPFAGESEASMLHSHLVEPPPKLTDARPELPQAINEVIATAMAKAKEDRYSSCGEFSRALRAVALGTGSTGPAPVFHTETAAPSSETVLSPAVTPDALPPPTAAPTPAPAPAPAPAAAADLSVEAPPAPASPPPTSPPPASAPEVPRSPRTVTLSGRRLAAIAAALVALVVVAVVAAIALTGGDDNKTAAGATTNAPATTQGGATTPGSNVAVGLAGVVPTPLLKYCDKVSPSPGAAETVACKPPAASTGAYYPNSWQLSLYPSTAALNKAYNAVRSDNDIGLHFGQCNGIEWGGEGQWAHGPGKPGGSRLCYFDGNVAVIVWTHEKLGQATHIDLLGVARSNGSDHSNLFNWYRFWHHRIGKCPQPDCVARLR